MGSPLDILNSPLHNKGSAFSEKERDLLNLHGLLPLHVSSIDEQVERRYANYTDLKEPVARYLFLTALQNRNEVLFFRLVLEYVTEMLPIIYTPTVAEISTRYSLFYREHRGLFLSYPLRERMEEIIERMPWKESEVAVVTDGSRVLGLGDVGVGGMAIPVAKTTLYSLFGGIHPSRVLPIHLDVGTDNKQLLADPLYLGWRHPRVTGKEYDAFIEQFISAIHRRFPNMVLQWEDFARPHARDLLDRYRKRLTSFNDDIQATATVVLAALYSALQVSKSSMKEQRIALLGGGSTGMGICELLHHALCQEGLTPEEAYERFFIVDRDGLIHDKMKGLDPLQKRFARTQTATLRDVVEKMKPTILIGVSTAAGAFTEEIVRTMAKHTERPIIFPLSNPTELSEAKPLDLYTWTEGRAIVATGSPFQDVIWKGKAQPISQCNNVYVFPGIGLGALHSGGGEITDSMLFQVARTLSNFSPKIRDPHAPLMPPLEMLREITQEIAAQVAYTALSERGKRPDIDALRKNVQARMWQPVYT